MADTNKPSPDQHPEAEAAAAATSHPGASGMDYDELFRKGRENGSRALLREQLPLTQVARIEDFGREI